MPSILYAIVALLFTLALPYLIAGWTMRHTTMRCMRIEPATAKDVPEHLKGIFKESIAELKACGFKMVSCHQIEYGSEKDGKQWGILLQHQSEQTYVGLVATQLVSSAAPLILTFMTFFEDETQLTTTNTPHFGIYSSSPQDIAQHVGTIAIAEQWQRHQQKLAELSQTRQPQSFADVDLPKMLEARHQSNVERLVKTREVSWVQPGASYRMSWWTAARAVYRVARKRRRTALPQTASSQPAASATAAMPLLELEIAEFHRLQQRQQEGMSRRGKNWLLLGTLALFVASYSSIFELQKLLIFVAVLLLHEGGHVLAMKVFGYRNTVMLFIPFLGALATARKDNASLTEKVWISLAGPLPGLVLGIGLAIAYSIPDLAAPGKSAWFDDMNWIRETSWMLIGLNLFNLLPIYPLDGGQVADLLLFSRNPYIGVVFKGMGVALLALLGLAKPLLLVFALLIAISIPASFRLAKLNARLRQKLRQFPCADRDGLLRFLFTELQEPPYRLLPFAKKYSLVLGLLDIRQEDSAKWIVRASLIGIYLVSLVGGLAGGLYALFPHPTAWTMTVSNLVDARGTYRHRLQQEMDAANRALQANSNDLAAYLKRGRAKVGLEDYQGAMADANQMLQINPDSGEAYQLRGLVRRRTGDTAGATADMQKSTMLIAQKRLAVLNQKLSQNPKAPAAYLERAGAYYSLKRYSETIADCNQALLIEPQNISAVLQRGQAYLALNQYPEALGNANHALRLNPSSGEAYAFRSQVRHQTGDEAGAMADEQKAEQLFQTQE